MRGARLRRRGQELEGLRRRRLRARPRRRARGPAPRPRAPSVRHQTPFLQSGSSWRFSRTASAPSASTRLRAGPAHRPAHAAGLDLRAQPHRLSVEARRQQQRGQPHAGRRADGRRRVAPPASAVPSARLRDDAQDAGHAGHAVVGEGHHQLVGALRACAATPTTAARGSRCRRRSAAKAVGMRLAGSGATFVGLRPQRPVVRADVEACRIVWSMTLTPAASTRKRGPSVAVVAVVAVLHHHRQPGRAVRERVDLDRLVEDHAVRAQPAAAADGQVLHGARCPPR